MTPVPLYLYENHASGRIKGMRPPTSSVLNGVHPEWHAPVLVKDPPTRTTFEFDSLKDALYAFSQGEFLVVMDDERRENEGDLICAASMCSTEKMAWIIKHTRYISINPRV